MRLPLAIGNIALLSHTVLELWVLMVLLPYLPERAVFQELELNAYVLMLKFNVVASRNWQRCCIESHCGRAMGLDDVTTIPARKGNIPGTWT